MMPGVNFPRFWAKGSHDGFECWRWSELSLAQAEALANQAAQKLADRFRAGDIARHGYAYPDRPFREPVLREVKNNAGEVVAVVTRNSYGCLVLNTARVMFVDVDLPERKSSGGGFFNKLFGKTKAAANDPAEAPALVNAEAWGKPHSGCCLRVYRTHAGLRLLATHALFDADGP